MRKNVAQTTRPQLTFQLLRIAWWITKASDTRLEYKILISFLRQQWLREQASMLPLHVHCLF